jgi:hypothetical protein
VSKDDPDANDDHTTRSKCARRGVAVLVQINGNTRDRKSLIRLPHIQSVVPSAISIGLEDVNLATSLVSGPYLSCPPATRDERASQERQARMAQANLAKVGEKG